MNTLFIDQKYIVLVSPQLTYFTKKDEGLYNFRCPICGDSKKNKYKTRGYFYAKNGRMRMCCHNCGTDMPFGIFLKRTDNSLYREYSTEVFMEKGGSTFWQNPDNFYTDDDDDDGDGDVGPPSLSNMITHSPTKTNPLNIPCILDLPSDHYARLYVADRKIPKDQWHRLYFSRVFSETIKDIIPGYYQIPRHKSMLKNKEARLVLPYYDRRKNLIGLTGRAFDVKNSKKYIIAKVSDDSPKIYGLDLIDPTKTIYVVEGPIDSLFLPNSVAVMDSKLYGTDEYFAGHGNLHRILVPDNQPRNADVCRMIKTAINKGETVCLWPHDIQEKDINDMVKFSNMTPSEILNIIHAHSYSGLRASMAFVN